MNDDPQIDRAYEQGQKAAATVRYHEGRAAAYESAARFLAALLERANNEGRAPSKMELSELAVSLERMSIQACESADRL